MTPTDFIYIAGPMRGIKEFNFPRFFAAEEVIRSIFPLAEVFNPARRDNLAYGVDISVGNETGDEGQAREEHGFDLREALAADLSYICTKATAIYMLEGWEKSRGATAERAAARALGIKIIYQNFEDREKPWDFDHGYSQGFDEGYCEGYDEGVRDCESEAANA